MLHAKGKRILKSVRKEVRPERRERRKDNERGKGKRNIMRFS
ncbi:MAG: hypothetical protein WB014_13215 [Methanosarcina sp.]